MSVAYNPVAVPFVESTRPDIGVGLCLGSMLGAVVQRRTDGDHWVRVSLTRSVYGEMFP